MKIFRTLSFKQDYKKLSEEIQKITENKLRLFLQDPRYPSLQTRKLRSGPTGKTWYGKNDQRPTTNVRHSSFVVRRKEQSYATIKN